MIKNIKYIDMNQFIVSTNNSYYRIIYLNINVIELNH